ncbi:MAG TPA: aminotransferase class V-fold PLP-dependent enzyme [Rhizomicrobium sp.]|jgi:isopenicillin-N epimerase|nr:aminotransferase class V-fold PLP-dependent enzyme [Rhizomicrobium sp.]
MERESARRAFELDPHLIHLNHGSYGAVPREVRVEQDRWRTRIEKNPTGFFQEEYPPLMRAMAQHVARRLGGDASDWVFCENATSAANGVLQSLDLKAGDELLTTSHAYGAVMKAMVLNASRRAAILTVAEVPAFPAAEDEVVSAIVARMSPRTRLLVIDHITSATALIFPVRRIAEAAGAAGVPIFVDGAHAPGQIALDVPSLGVDWYTGNAHKWLFAPRGCGVLWTHPARQAMTRPVVLSHGTDQGYTAAFDWIGTRDPSPWFCFETAALAHDAFGGAALMAGNRRLADEVAGELSAELDARIAGPSAMRGSMAALRLMEGCEDPEKAAAYRRRLASEHRIMVPVYAFAGALWLRISAQIYNVPGDYRGLARACRELVLGEAGSRRSALSL